jgi:hypothetical protein
LPLHFGFASRLQARLTLQPRRDAAANRRPPLVTTTPRPWSKARMKLAPGQEKTMLSGDAARFAGAAPAAAATATAMATTAVAMRFIFTQLYVAEVFRFLVREVRE